MSTERQKRILVIDDDPAIVRAITINLQSVGYEALVAHDGADGLRKIVTGEPDLIILDIMMPEIDGFEVLKMLRDNPTTRHIPVIMLTAFPTDENVARSYGLDTDCFIPKPFEPEVLLLVIQRLLTAAEERRLAHDAG
ncbi:MAG: response regulator [Abditibacteriales bacterium]|nr:response regulator [Abditibacteriales bacterium]MDW8365043.1 response regulator [Abditibacteriales bacterium]